MLCGCGWFAAMVLFIKALDGVCDWQMVMLFRTALATVLAFAMAIASRAKLEFPGSPTLWLRSISGSLSMLTTFYALMHLPGSDVLVITNSFPIWLALFSWPVLGERPTLAVSGAVLCAVLGIAVTQKLDLENFQLAHLAAVFASIFTAIAMMGLNRLKGVSSLGVVTHFSAVSTLFCIAAFLIFPREIGPTRVFEPWILFELCMVGLTATIGQVFLTKAFRAGTATKVSVVGLSQVVMVMAWEYFAKGFKLGDWTLDAWKIAGTILVLGPTAYLMARERRAMAPKKDDEAVVEEAAIE